MISKLLISVMLMLTLTGLCIAEDIAIDGLWADINSADFTRGTMIIAQDGDAIHVSHYVEYKGVAMVEYGIGTRQGDELDYQVVVTRPIPGWVEKGRHTLTLSADGQQLKGQYHSTAGSGPLLFERVGK
ncbi:hypothetical protein [Shewanella sp. UCD-KL12]|uniref:hypothetical protein n=1 Tax=Shewanella sp. UCD-KL12 TaxID=1917163 RepID=UPI000970DFF3|nr:hypothetical protein [Shewanella sp. UCD-KL12]